MSWHDLQTQDPDLAAFGTEQFAGGVAYLGTIRKDGSPRVRPVTPITGDGRLFLFMEPKSPKVRDLARDARYDLHSPVSDSSGASGEFFVNGKARRVDDAEAREAATSHSSFRPEDHYILFELSIERATSTVYDDGVPAHRTWTSTNVSFP